MTFLWELFSKFLSESRWKYISKFLRCFKTFSVNCFRILFHQFLWSILWQFLQYFFGNSTQNYCGNFFRKFILIFFFFDNASDNSFGKLLWKYFRQFLRRFLSQFLRKFPLECAKKLIWEIFNACGNSSEFFFQKIVGDFSWIRLLVLFWEYIWQFLQTIVESSEFSINSSIFFNSFGYSGNPYEISFGDSFGNYFREFLK